MSALTKTLLPVSLFTFAGAAVFAVAPSAGGAGDVPFTFEAGKPARAAEVNANFEALALRILDLELEVAELREKTQFFQVDTAELEGLVGPHLIVEGANVHVRSGSGATDESGAPTGLGNLVIGYNELGALDAADRAGAHNLVMGSRNAYTAVAGIVAGTDNGILAPFASITGGQFGTASGIYATITGGGGATSNLFNVATGEHSSITGGFRNIASGNQSTVTGGSNHEASGFLTSISGGTSNQTIGAGASISGGAGNIALGANSSVSGGQQCTVDGVSASISGGLETEVNANFDCADCN